MNIANILMITTLLISASNCQNSDPATSIRVSVTWTETIKGINQLEIKAHRDGDTADKAKSAKVPDSATALKSGIKTVIAIPDDWAGKTIALTITGYDDKTIIGQGQLTAQPKLHESIDITITLAPPCQDECADGRIECVGDATHQCAKTTQGCLTWQPPAACDKDVPYCSNGKCAAKCEDECKTGERRCDGAGYQLCGNHDSDTCLDWGNVIGCGDKEMCQDGGNATEGQCVPSCNGKPCSCQPGQTQVCADKGECKGGISQCVDGKVGACDWQVGPTAEVCDGKDNDCSGTSDDNLIAPACEKQLGVCLGAVKTCKDTAGWSACDTAVYSAAAQKNGAAYEATEKSCDGKDNNCDGKVDEPAACAPPPKCASSACGVLGCCGDRCCELLPSNSTYMGKLEKTGIIVELTDVNFDTSTECTATSKLGKCTLVAAPSSAVATDVCVCRVDAMTLGSLTVTGGPALAIFSFGDVKLLGLTDISAYRAQRGPGAIVVDPGDGSTCGGSFGTFGGSRGGSTFVLPPYGDVTLTPLVGGMNGQDEEGASVALGGGGGGALQITAATKITVGNINAGGGGGEGGPSYKGTNHPYFGAGGGSGGGILLEAPVVGVASVLSANGGGGGGGGNNDGGSGGGDGDDAALSGYALGGSGNDGNGCPLYGYTNGGDGGAGSSKDGNGAPGQSGDHVSCLQTSDVAPGGGGGGAGRIRINTLSGSPISGTFSPSPSFGKISIK